MNGARFDWEAALGPMNNLSGTNASTSPVVISVVDTTVYPSPTSQTGFNFPKFAPPDCSHPINFRRIF